MNLIQKIVCLETLLKNISCIYIVDVVIEYINLFILMLIVLQVFNIDKDVDKIEKYLITSWVLYAVQKLVIIEPYNQIAYILTMTILLINIFEVKLAKGIVIQAIIITIVSIIEIPFIKIYCQIHNVQDINEVMQTPMFKLSLSLTNFCIISIFYLIAKKLEFSIGLIKKCSKKEYTKNFVFLFIGISIIYIQLFQIQNLKNTQLIIISILNSICIILFYYISMCNTIKSCKIERADIKINNLEVHNKNLSNINDSLRCFRHDFYNIIQAMNGYIMLKDIDSLEEYFQEVLKECNDIKSIEKLNPNLINNPAIYSILADKYQCAEKHGIKIDVDISYDFKFTSTNTYELTRMIGILLDNAIEAARECKEKIIKVEFIKENKNKKVIVIENTYNDTNVDIEEIFQKEFSTKNQKRNTGLGLWEIKKIICKNSNLDLHTIKDDEMFRQQIEIYT